MSEFPKVTIILATYNRAHFILETLQSIQNQSYLNWECIIIDDGGTDNTVEVIRPILANDDRFQYLKRPNQYKKGLPGSRNYGLDIAKGEYIIFFDDDDIMHIDNLKLCVKEIAKGNYDFCRYLRATFYADFNQSFEMNENYKTFEIDINDIEKIITNEIRFNSCQVMWKNHCFRNNRYKEELMFAEEWEFYPRILSNGLKGISIEKVLFYGRKHIHSNTGEFFNNDPIRIASKVEASLLIIKNLKEKGLITNSIIPYFIRLSLNYRKFKLFEQILNILELNGCEKIKWQILYKTLPLRLKLYKFKLFLNSEK